jgi:hypothetical protein
MIALSPIALMLPDADSLVGAEIGAVLELKPAAMLILSSDLASKGSPLTCHIGHVFGMSAGPEVSRIRAFRVIPTGAIVADLFTVRDWAVMNSVGNDVGSDRLPAVPTRIDSRITVRLASQPRPAGIRGHAAQHFLPIPLNERAAASVKESAALIRAELHDPIRAPLRLRGRFTAMQAGNYERVSLPTSKQQCTASSSRPPVSASGRAVFSPPLLATSGELAAAREALCHVV